MNTVNQDKVIAFEYGSPAVNADWVVSFIPSIVFGYYQQSPYRFSIFFFWLNWAAGIKFFRNL